jgi:16S rRNA (cytidine1402-2'-O)-methyltransferase
MGKKRHRNIVGPTAVKSDTGKLYIVSTPIGNLDDITLRAMKVLNTVDLIAAEDTRRTAGLLNHHYIHCPMIALHEHNLEQQVPVIIHRLSVGQKVALVSDAGTPTVSDPAFQLIRAALQREIPVIPVPGVSAVLTALTGAGLPMNLFCFYGFIPRQKAARLRLFDQIGQRGETAVLFESPHRVKATIRELVDCLPGHRLVLAREMTKVHEEYLRGTADQIMAMLEKSPVRGEFTLVIAPGLMCESEVTSPPD